MNAGALEQARLTKVGIFHMERRHWPPWPAPHRAALQSITRRV